MRRKQFFAMNLAATLLLSLLFIPVSAVQLEDRSHVHNHIDIAYKSPHSQFADKVPLTTIKCSEDLELIMKKTNGMPACVKHSTATILLERGWGIHVLPDYKNEDNNSDLLKESKSSFAVKTLDVTYFENYTGYLAMPDTEDQQSFPAIILIHEFWGLNENMKEMAEQLASHGYLALAVDLYGVEEAAATSDEARQLMSAYDQEQGIKNMRGAVEYLKTNYGAQKVGSIGWCFGGGQSLVLALNEQMDATVIYYGRVISDKDQLSSINWPVLGIFAGLDTGITVESVNEFEKALDELGIPNEIHIYPDVNHAFANPSGARYAPEETKDAWEKTLTFFESTLKQ
ncbi:dienelactone hydrolase family protein [Candidatus Nitrosotenuis uzonensis]|uniref:Carboxymethylenebutenolidase (Modular protein) n=1 Tax=Candidatus Nitrosotenuis uzonensis TaxID=1407055 RepID=V6AUM0_9ARCH|nr:dienelactone hydrolase family protein [Candidatus Nitrosotenuis uzonensis]CDI06239.1 Carboxymethylenebutenolidase (modular protein) [Candidatus Nitrosotenuis uzonensis]